MVILCPSCNSTTIFDEECQSRCCSACGLVLDDQQFNNIDETIETPKNDKIPPLLEARYRPIFEQLQTKFSATDEETEFVRQLCFLYLSHPQHIFENSALEVVLCLFYLVVLQHLHDQSLLLSDYCELVNGDSHRCRAIYASIRPIVSTKLATLPTDSDPQQHLDNIMRFLYTPLLHSTSRQQRTFFSYHVTPFTAHKRSKQQRKRQKLIAPTISTISPLPSGSSTTTDVDDNNTTLPHNTDDDAPANLGPGKPLAWPNDMNDLEIRQQTTQLVTVAKYNGLADGRYGRPLVAACLLVTMLGRFHRDQQQQSAKAKNTKTPKSRAASLLPVVTIHWDELNACQLVNSTTKSRYKEIVGLLYTFGKTLPWIKDNLAMERDALHYLDDILQMMNVLQNSKDNNNNHTTISAPTSCEQHGFTAPGATTSSSDSTLPTVHTTAISPSLPPSFERSTRIRQKRRAELDAFDQRNHTQQQTNGTDIWDEDSGLPDAVRMVASLMNSQQYDREAILAMSDSELVKHSYRFTINNTTNSNSVTLDLDRQLDDFDLSNEELTSYLV